MPNNAFAIDFDVKSLNVLIDRAIDIRVVDDLPADLVLSYPEPYEPAVINEGQVIAIRPPTMAAPASARLEIALSPSAARQLTVNIVNEGSSVRAHGLPSVPVRIGNFRLQNSSADGQHVAFTGGLVVFKADYKADGVQKSANFSDVIIGSKQLINVSGVLTSLDVSRVEANFTETPLIVETDCQTPTPVLRGVAGQHRQQISDHGIPTGLPIGR